MDDDKPPELARQEKREKRAIKFKLRDGWMRVPGSNKLLGPQAAMSMLQSQQVMQHQPAYQMSTPGYASTHETQMAQYQDTTQHTLSSHNQILHHYQNTMQQSFDRHWTQPGGPGSFAYQATPALPAPSNPPPIHWRLPIDQSGSTDTMTDSTPATKIPQQPEGPVQKTSRQSTVKPKSSRPRITPEQRLTNIQQKQSSILNYKPPALGLPTAQAPTLASTPTAELLMTKADALASTPTAELPITKADALTSTPTAELPMPKADAPTWTPSSRFKTPELPTAKADAMTWTPPSKFKTQESFISELSTTQASTLTRKPLSKFKMQESSAPELPPAQAPTLSSTTTAELPMPKTDAPTWTPSSGFKTQESSASDLLTAQAGALTWTPPSKFKALKFPTAQADTPTLENISQDLEHVLLSEPDSHWTIHDIPIGSSSIERLKRRYSDNTFQLLRATTPNLRPGQTHVVLSDEGYKSIPLTDKTTDILFVVFQANRFTIGHWIMVSVSLAGMEIKYYDTIGRDQDPEDQDYYRSCQKVLSITRSALADKGLPVPQAEFTCHRQRTFKQADGEDCGPFSWAYVEAALDPGSKAAIFKDPRLRYISQVYQALVEVGVPRPTTKRKQDEIPLPNGHNTKKVAKVSKVQALTTDRPRRQVHIPGKYREISPVPTSDFDDDDYDPLTQDTEDENESESYNSN